MSIDVYKAVHICGLLLTLFSVGMILITSQLELKMKLPKMLHGTGILITLIGGFGLLARLGIHWPWPQWVFIKVAAWSVLAIYPLFIRKATALAYITSFITLGITFFAVYAVVFR